MNITLKENKTWETFCTLDLEDWALCIRLGTFCNLSCSYCLSYSSPSGTRPPSQFTDVVFSVLDRRPRRIIVSGGEPLIYPETVSIVSRALRRQIAIKIGTNGIVSSRRHAWLRKFRDSPLILDVSLHGVNLDESSPITGLQNVSKAIRKIAEFSSAGLRVTANLPLIRDSIENYKRTISHCIESGAMRVKLTRIFEIGHGKTALPTIFMTQEDEDLYAKTLRKHFGSLVQGPLSNQEQFESGTLLLTPDCGVTLAGKPLGDISESQILRLKARNNELYVN